MIPIASLNMPANGIGITQHYDFSDLFESETRVTSVTVRSFKPCPHKICKHFSFFLLFFFAQMEIMFFSAASTLFKTTSNVRYAIIAVAFVIGRF